MTAHGESIWKLWLGVLVLLFVAGVGGGHILYSDYFIKRTAMRRGGDMLTEWNRTGAQFVGLLVTLFSVGVLYELCKDIFAK